VLEVTFTCPFCSRMFIEDCPYTGGIPRHLDPLLGTPCQGSGAPVACFLEIPEHPHAQHDWPTFHSGRLRRSR
jgi:hypothetical protein